MPKIIYSDNIPTDMSSESLWLDKVDVGTAQRVCNKLNERLGNNQGPFYRVVPDNHKLYKWEP